MTDYPPPGGSGGYGSQGGSGDYPPPGGQQPYGQPGYGQDPYGQQRKPGTNGLAIAALVVAFLIGPLGVILGLVAKSQIKKTGQGGDGLATAAIVVGALNMLLGACTVAGIG
jgi:hypothetical protein